MALVAASSTEAVLFNHHTTLTAHAHRGLLLHRPRNQLSSFEAVAHDLDQLLSPVLFP